MEKNEKERSYQSIFNYFSKIFSVDVLEYSTKKKKLHLPKIPLKLLLDLLRDASLIFQAEPTIIRTSSPLVVVGDIHGHLLDLFRILKNVGCPSNDFSENSSINKNTQNNQNVNNNKNNADLLLKHTNYPLKSDSPGFPFLHSDKPDQTGESSEPAEKVASNTKYLFLGDFVDRGQFSFETIILILTMKLLWPSEIIIVRGNHEFKTTFMQGNQSFGAELRDLYSSSIDEVSDAFEDCFSFIPLAAIIDGRTICLHGGVGLSIKSGNLGQIEREVIRPIHDFSNDMVSDLLWSDPSEYILHFQPSSRGSGSFFGLKALESFLAGCSLSCMIRGHQCVDSGVCSLWDDKCFTVFSASNYCGVTNNRTGILMVTKTDFSPATFDPIPTLQRSAAVLVDIGSEINGLPSIQSPPLLLPRSPLAISKKRKFQNRAKSQTIARKSQDLRPGPGFASIGMAQIQNSPSPICKKGEFEKVILHPSRPKKQKNEEMLMGQKSFSFKTTKKPSVF